MPTAEGVMHELALVGATLCGAGETRGLACAESLDRTAARRCDPHPCWGDQLFSGKSPATGNRGFSASGRHIRRLMVLSSNAMWADWIAFVVEYSTQNHRILPAFN
jgi:hypothetical protein